MTQHPCESPRALVRTTSRQRGACVKLLDEPKRKLQKSCSHFVIHKVCTAARQPQHRGCGRMLCWFPCVRAWNLRDVGAGVGLGVDVRVSWDMLLRVWVCCRCVGW